MKLVPDQAPQTDVGHLVLSGTVYALVADGLVPEDAAEAWLSCHAVVLADASWARCLHPRLRSWLGLDETHFKPLVVKLYEAPVAASVSPKS